MKHLLTTSRVPKFYAILALIPQLALAGLDPTGAGGGGAATNLTAPGPIGSVTPGTGAFTTLSNTGAATNSAAGAVSAPALTISGVPSSAGTTTTDFPLLYINDASATASTTLNTAGTYFGVNGDGTQDLMNLLKDGVSMVKVDSVGMLTLKVGSSGAPAMALGGVSVYDNSGAGIVFRTGGVNRSYLAYNGAWMPVGQPWGWSSTADATGTPDTALHRNAAGVVEVNNGTAGTWRDLKLRNITPTGGVGLAAFTVATLPATAATGMFTGAMAYVTDATAPTYLGALTGGGAVVCPVFYNGSAWVSH